MITIGLDSCKSEKKIPEPVFVLKKWAKSIEELNYRLYTLCEAYPKDVAVFRDMYKDYYIIDLMALEVEDEDKEDIKRDYKNDPFLQRTVTFEGTAVKRDTKKSFQLIRGDAEFVKFLEGERKNDGWLMSNRTITRINK
jgi:hypothetical protein